MKKGALNDDSLFVCVLHGKDWSNSDAKSMFEVAGIPYRKVKSIGSSDRYLVGEVTEGDMSDLVQARKHLPMFRAFIFFTRFGRKFEDVSKMFPKLEKYTEDHGCPFEGWPPKR